MKFAGGMAMEGALKAATKVPVIGGFVELIKETKEKFEALTDQPEHVREVSVWAKQIMSALSDNPCVDQSLGAPAISCVEYALGKLAVLIEIAADIEQGNKVESYLKGAVFKKEFEDAQGAVKRAVEALGFAIAIDTNLKVHESLELQRQHMSKLEQIAGDAKFAKDAALDEAVKHQAAEDRHGEEMQAIQAKLEKCVA